MNLNLKVALALVSALFLVKPLHAQFCCTPSCGNSYLDKSFNVVGYDTTIASTPYRVMTTSGGRYVLAGVNYLARYFSNGTLDLSFGTNGYAAVSGMGSFADGLQISSGHYVLMDNDQLWFFDSSGSLATNMATSGILNLPVLAKNGGGMGNLNAKEFLEHPLGGLAILTHRSHDSVALLIGADSFRQAMLKTTASGLIDSSFGNNGLSIFSGTEFKNRHESTFTIVPSEQRIFVADGYGAISSPPLLVQTRIRALFYDGSKDTSNVISIASYSRPCCLRYEAGRFYLPVSVIGGNGGQGSFAYIVDTNGNSSLSNTSFLHIISQDLQLYDAVGIGKFIVTTSYPGSWSSRITTVTDSLEGRSGFFGTSAFENSTGLGPTSLAGCGQVLRILHVAQDSVSKDIYLAGTIGPYYALTPLIARISGQCLTTSLALTATVTSPIICPGDSTNVALAATGGLPNYAFGLAPTATFTTNNLVKVPAGTHTFSVQDSTGCIKSTTLTVTQPAAINVVASATQIICMGGNSTISLSATNGTAPYTFGEGVNPVFSNNNTFVKPAGIYIFWAKDANGCSSSIFKNVVQPSQLGVNVSTSTIFCYGNSANITLSGYGGVSSYSYAMGAVPVFSSSSSFSSQPAGTYTIWVKDAVGCSTSSLVTLTQPPQVTVNVNATPIPCFATSGTSTITVSGSNGNSPYTYAEGAFPSYSSNSTFVRSIGTYTIWVKDAIGCTNTSIVDIAPALPGIASASNASMSINNIYCDNIPIDSVLCEPTISSDTSCIVNYQWYWSPSFTGQQYAIAGATSQHLTNFSLQSIIPQGQYSSFVYLWRIVKLASCGCTDSVVSNKVQYNVYRAVTATAPLGATFCNGLGSIQLIGGATSSGNLGAWYAGGALFSSGDTCIATSPGTYAFVDWPSSGYAACDTAKVSLADVTSNATVTVNGNTLTANQANATYQWASCDNNGNLININGANSQSYAPTAAGLYAVQVTVANCTDTSTCVQFWPLYIDNTTEKQGLQIVPNPAQNIFTLHVVQQLVGSNYQILNTSGQLVYEGQFVSAEDRVDVSSWAAGVYVVRCKLGNYYMLVQH
ncbi:MAG: hypothetical protein RL660_164 [Bacteroidota bacterium]|jgi:hypothetical protein